MNHRMVFSTVGKIIGAEALMLLLPLVTAAIYREQCFYSILIAAIVALVLGTVLTVAFRPKSKVIYAREGFCITAMAWLAMSAVGALPFVLSGEIPRYIDAFFETVSGFTTTGASILMDVEAMSRGLLMWRSFTHWVGGMGVLVFVMAILPGISDRSIHIMRAEMPGPIVGKLVPRAKDTASILYKIYIVMTVVMVGFLLAGGMDLFESLVHAFGTAGTGGFGIKGDSIGGYSPYLQWVITIFMFLFGINFNLYYLLLIRRFRSVTQSTELWTYCGIVLTASVLILWNILPAYGFADGLRHAVFQVVSIITTSGFSTTNFDMWPLFSKVILVLLMFVGACAGSTGGGFKISRVLLLGKNVSRQVRQLVHPRSVSVLKSEGKPIDDATVNSVGTYLAVYLFFIVVIWLLLCLEPFSFEANFVAAVSCFNNIGPGLNETYSTFAGYSDFSKLLLSFAMLFGRLEIYPMLIALYPGTWKKH